MPRQGSNLSLPVPRGFDLKAAVCSYGYFVLAPNRWDTESHTFTCPLRARRDRVVKVTISQPRSNRRTLRLVCDKRMEPAERPLIKAQVVRTLRVDEDLSPWFKLHPIARKRKFGRLFRSPTLFEDIVKTITGCNVTWTNTIRMNKL